MTHRQPKKTETIEVRVPEELKSGFLSSCRRRGQSASAALREFMADRIADPNDRSLISKGMALMKNPTISIPALLSVPVIAAAFFAASSAANADDVELMFEITIRNASSEQAVNGVINLDFGRDATFRLSPARDEAGDYFYDVNLEARPCDTNGELQCASENVMVSVEVIRHDDAGQRVIASPQLQIRYGGQAGMRVEPRQDGFSISIEMFADYANPEES